MGAQLAIIYIPWSIDKTTIATDGADTAIKLWNVLTGDCIRSLVGHTKTIGSLCYVRDSIIASGSSAGGGDKTIRVWNIKDYSVFTLQGHRNFVSSVLNVKWLKNQTSLLSGLILL